MENKKYLDKVVEFLERGTKIDYKKRLIDYPFYSISPNIRSVPIIYPLSIDTYPMTINFSKYCNNTFGLTDDEIDYVWKEYRSIILNKIKNGK